VGCVKSRWYLGASIIGATTIAQLEDDIATAQFELDGPTLGDSPPSTPAIRIRRGEAPSLQFALKRTRMTFLS
jgi:hypothetical protein